MDYEIKKNIATRKFNDWYRPGFGTENVAPFLQSLINLTRPTRILEVGIGYTTPFLIEGLQKNNNINIDNTFNEKYLEVKYDPKIVIIDDDSLGKSIPEVSKDVLQSYKFLEIIKGKFQGKSKDLFSRFGKFDFVWFDCGGRDEYESFIKEYWDICSDYIIFHYTYYNLNADRYGTPNDLLKSILRYAKKPYFQLDIIEPHKKTQGSLTILRKEPLCQNLNN